MLPSPILLGPTTTVIPPSLGLGMGMGTGMGGGSFLSSISSSSSSSVSSFGSPSSTSSSPPSSLQSPLFSTYDLEKYGLDLGQSGLQGGLGVVPPMTMYTSVDLTPVIQRLLLEMNKLGTTAPMLDVVALSECGELIAGTAAHDIKLEDGLVAFSQPPSNEPSTSRPHSEMDLSQRKRVFDKPCAICNGLASGYHYETPSCNSCKTFFRRTVISAKNYKCIKGDGQCLSGGKIPAKIKCRQCRFLKCIQQGMRPETVSTSKDGICTPTIKNEVQSYSPAESPSSSYNTEPSISPQVDIVVYAHCISALGEIDERIRLLRHSDFDPFQSEIGLITLLNQPSLLDQVNKFNQISDWLAHPRVSPSRGPCLESPSCRDLPEWLCLDLICAVEYMKRFALFNAMSFAKQCEVIHRCALPLSMAVLCFDSVAQGHSALMLPDGISPVSILPTVFFNVCDPWRREQVDQTEYLLLKALLFHEMMLQTETTTEVIEDRGKYVRFLFEYLKKKVGQGAPSRMASLIAISQQLITTANKHRAHVLASDSVRARNHERLVREIILREPALSFPSSSSP